MIPSPVLNVHFLENSFSPGSKIQGEFLLTLQEAFEISGIYLQLHGYERVRFRQRNDGSVSNESTVVGDDWDSQNGKTINTGIPTILPISQPNFLQSVILSTTQHVTRHRSRLQPGIHSFPFSICLPSPLPPTLSFTSGSKYQASVEYSVTFQVFPFTASHRKLSKSSALTATFPVVIAPLTQRGSLNSFLRKSFSVGHAACCGILQKHVKFKADWEKGAFAPDQSVNVSVSLSLSANCTLRTLSVKLVRELVLMVDEQTFRTVDPMEKAKFCKMVQVPPNLPFSASTTLKIPKHLTPSTRTNAIDCRYFLVFEVDFRWYRSVLLAEEIIINP